MDYSKNWPGVSVWTNDLTYQMLTQGSNRYVFNGIGKLHFFLPVSFVLNTMTFREDKAGVRVNWVQNTLTSAWYVTVLYCSKDKSELRYNRTAAGSFILTNRKNQRVCIESYSKYNSVADTNQSSFLPLRVKTVNKLVKINLHTLKSRAFRIIRDTNINTMYWYYV